LSDRASSAINHCSQWLIKCHFGYKFFNLAMNLMVHFAILNIFLYDFNSLFFIWLQPIIGQGRQSRTNIFILKKSCSIWSAVVTSNSFWLLFVWLRVTDKSLKYYTFYQWNFSKSYQACLQFWLTCKTV